jgi:predicted nucleotide-binding protein (sugar kinase/HSP70/actin superfamily)
MLMASACGPCRLGQYTVYLKDIIASKKLINLGVIALSDENSFSGFGNDFILRAFIGITIGDVMQNIYYAILALAVDKTSALESLKREWEKIIAKIEGGTSREIYAQLKHSAAELNTIKRIHSLDDAVKVALVGEIFVRHEDFSKKELVKKLLENNIVIKTEPVVENLLYTNYQVKRLYRHQLPTLGSRMKFKLKEIVQRKIELRIKKILAQSGFVEYQPVDIELIVKHSANLIPTEMEGEAVLTVGSALSEIVNHASGVVSLGPFGCMHSRVAESILNMNMNASGKAAASGKPVDLNGSEIINLPFLAVETDGNLFPQIIQSKLEIFILQTLRLHRVLKAINKKEGIFTE